MPVQPLWRAMGNAQPSFKPTNILLQPFHLWGFTWQEHPRMGTRTHAHVRDTRKICLRKRFVVAKDWKRPSHPPTRDWLNIWQCLQIMPCYSAIRKTKQSKQDNTLHSWSIKKLRSQSLGFTICQNTNPHRTAVQIQGVDMSKTCKAGLPDPQCRLYKF